MLSRKITASPFIAICASALLLVVSWSFIAGHKEIYANTIDEDTMDVLLAGMRHAASSIRSGRGTVIEELSLKSKNGEALESKTSYTVVFLGDKFKISSEDKYRTSSAGVINHPEDQPSHEAIRGVIAYDGERAIHYKPLERRASVGDVTSPTGRQAIALYNTRINMLWNGVYSIEAAAMLPKKYNVVSHKPTVIGRETVNGDDCILLELGSTTEFPTGPREGKGKVWVCPSKGFTVPRMQGYGFVGASDNMKLIFETNAEMRRYDSDLWGPAKAVRVQYGLDADGQYGQVLRQTIIYDTNFELNVPVNEDELKLTIPSGTEVFEELLDALYTVP